MILVRTAAVLALAAAVLSLAARDAASRPATDIASTVPGEVVFRFHPDESPGLRLKVTALTSHLRFFSSMDEVHYDRYLNSWRVKVPADRTTSEIIAFLKADPAIEFAQPNFRYTNADAPDDPLYLEKQHPYYAAVNASAAWAAGHTGDGVTVAVIDGGVDIHHPEIADHIWTNVADPEDGSDNDGNGCIDDIHGCSFVGGMTSSDVQDFDGHGTFAAGIIAAASGNGEGVAGVAPGATIMPVRTLDSEGNGETEWLTAAVLYAAANGARVINLSLALLPEGGTCPADPLVENALRQAHDVHGATIVAAAGNFNLPCVGFPASSPYTIATGASGPPNEPDIRAFFSQWGPEVDVTAPGIDIVSTCPVPTLVPTGYCSGGPYGTGSGTSFSTPIVAGAAALLLAQDPGRTNEDVRDRLRSTALPLPDEQTPNWDGAGRIDIAASLGAGAGHIVLDITSPDISLLDLSVVVGDPAFPLCRASLWSQPDISGSGLQGSFGAGECASYWPPRDDRPWLLYGSSGTRKPATLNGWAVRTEDSVCTTPGSVVLPHQPGIISTNTCAGTDLVSNDKIEGARVVSLTHLPVAFATDLRHATSAGDSSPTCANESSRGVWYRFEWRDDVGVAVDTFGSAFNTVLAVYRDDGATLDQIACNNDFSSSQSRVVWSAERGQAYYVLATAYQVVPAGRLRVHFSVADIPANDSREGALPTSPADPQPVVHQAHSATSSPSDPAFSCVPFYGYSLWYRVPAATGGLTARTSGSNYDTVVAVYREGEDGALTEIACNDQEGPGIKTSVASWTGDGGDYLVVVAAYPGFVGGVLQLTVTQD